MPVLSKDYICPVLALSNEIVSAIFFQNLDGDARFIQGIHLPRSSTVHRNRLSKSRRTLRVTASPLYPSAIRHEWREIGVSTWLISLHLLASNIPMVILSRVRRLSPIADLP